MEINCSVGWILSSMPAHEVILYGLPVVRILPRPQGNEVGRGKKKEERGKEIDNGKN
jgi:hypothetical protein